MHRYGHRRRGSVELRDLDEIAKTSEGRQVCARFEFIAESREFEVG